MRKLVGSVEPQRMKTVVNGTFEPALSDRRKKNHTKKRIEEKATQDCKEEVRQETERGGMSMKLTIRETHRGSAVWQAGRKCRRYKLRRRANVRRTFGGRPRSANLRTTG